MSQHGCVAGRFKIARERGHGELQYGNVAHLPEVDAGVAGENGTKGINLVADATCT